MSINSHWLTLEEELASLDRTGTSVRFWLRDDDAIGPSPALDRLLALSQDHDVPLALAVIPALAGTALTLRLQGEELVTPVVHGWSHRNHAPAGGKKQELGSHRPAATVTAELSEARSRMIELFGNSFLPMLVPPWNRIAPELLPYLRALEFQALSGFGPSVPAASVPMVNTHLDLMDWRGTRGCRDHGLLIEELRSLLRMHAVSNTPIGVLTHHLVHDDSAWIFLDRLFKLTEGRWLSARDVILAECTRVPAAP